MRLGFGRSTSQLTPEETAAPRHASPIRQIDLPIPLVSPNCIQACSHKLFSMERQVTEPIDAVFPRVVLNRTVDGSLPRLTNVAGQ
ncbi:hypothetical protein [Paraburkholderia caffeinilytica]|uniref:hypothetical protein n=1 Tax=Paraburkholderia caffeinilytica TaxID=1761016 RepID=UPI001E4D5A7C|nr:hypothetical protein [Paraburkholderia caffeinilytica]